MKLRVRDLERQKQDRLLVFGKNIPQLLNLIEKNKHRFRRVPIGPIGLFFSSINLFYFYIFIY